VEYSLRQSYNRNQLIGNIEADQIITGVAENMENLQNIQYSTEQNSTLVNT